MLSGVTIREKDKKKKIRKRLEKLEIKPLFGNSECTARPLSLRAHLNKRKTAKFHRSYYVSKIQAHDFPIRERGPPHRFEYL